MLIAEEEIVYLPRLYTLPPSKVLTFIWQHEMSSSTLLDFAHIYTPLIDFTAYEGLNETRLLEKLSIDILTRRLLGPKAQLLRLQTGRPILDKNLSPHIYIKGCSISHTGRRYALSLSTLRHGTDIERFRPKALRLASRFLSPEEYELFEQLRPITGNDERTAITLWSAKEAAYKYLDTEWVDFSRDLRLSFDGAHNLGVQYGKDKANISIHTYPDFVLTTCVGKTQTNELQTDLASAQASQRP